MFYIIYILIASIFLILYILKISKTKTKVKKILSDTKNQVKLAELINSKNEKVKIIEELKLIYDLSTNESMELYRYFIDNIN